MLLFFTAQIQFKSNVFQIELVIRFVDDLRITFDRTIWKQRAAEIDKGLTKHVNEAKNKPEQIETHLSWSISETIPKDGHQHEI